MSWQVINADCIEAMQALDESSIDAIVTDPPYGIGFMGHAWDQPGKFGAVTKNGKPGEHKRRPNVGDHTKTRERDGAIEAGRYDLSLTANQRFQEWCEAWAIEALRVLKPGGHLLSFGGCRTYHRMVAGIEDAGFEIRDQVAWLFGSGFPKSLDVSRAIDSAAGVDRGMADVPVTPDAQTWAGWGTALKPGHEPIVVARKPLGRTVAANVTEHGTGAINVSGCRIDVGDQDYSRNCSGDRGHDGTRSKGERGVTDLRPGGGSAAEGRWPANVVLDPGAAAMLDQQTGQLASGANPTRRSSDKFRNTYGDFAGESDCRPARGADVGGASRFFYCAKTSRAERNAGLEGFPVKPLIWSSGEQSPGTFQSDGTERAAKNHHPTVKPIALMRWLCRLVTQPGGTILDPFTGSGTTGCAAVLEQFNFIGIERDPEYMPVAEARIAWWAEHPEGVDLIARIEAEAERAARADLGQMDLEDLTA